MIPDAAELEKVIGRVRGAGIATERTDEGVLVRDPAHIGMLLTVI